MVVLVGPPKTSEDTADGIHAADLFDVEMARGKAI